MFLSGLIHIEIVFEQSCQGMDDTIEQLLSRCVHQNVPAFDHSACGNVISVVFCAMVLRL